MALDKKSLTDQANRYVEVVRPQVESAVVNARNAVEDFVESTAKPYLEEVREKTGPAISDARAKAAPVIADYKARTAPVIATGAGLVADKAMLAKEYAEAKAAELQAAVEPQKKSRKWLKLVLLAAAAGAAAFGAKRYLAGGQDDWQSDYIPAPPPAPAEDDAAGADPAEAVADATDEAHPPSTPDNPAEVVDLDNEQR